MNALLPLLNTNRQAGHDGAAHVIDTKRQAVRSSLYLSVLT